MKTWIIRVEERPTPYQVQRALAQRDDLEKPYQKIEIPKMSYPTSEKWSVASKWGFIKQFLP